jgi:hypothetical protein
MTERSHPSSLAPTHETLDGGSTRGLEPAHAADAGWSEGLAAFLAGPQRAIPFDFWEPPSRLFSRVARGHRAPSRTGTSGARFWSGVASLLGLENLRPLLAELQEDHRGRPLAASRVEELLLARSSNPSVVDAFHRFVYGLDDASPAPQLWLRNAVQDPGADQWSGVFWDSPDVWVRNHDDGGEAHQSPRPDQDNWFHARVRNKPTAGPAPHFVVAFRSRGFAGTQLIYPTDFYPCSAATAEFDLAPGETRVVKARWPRALVPPPGDPLCVLAAIMTRADHPIAGRHPWEHNNLAQKCLFSLSLVPGQPVTLPVVLGNSLASGDSRFDLELLVPNGVALESSLIHRSREFFAAAELPATELPGSELPGSEVSGWRMALPNAARALPVTLAPFSQTRLMVELAAPRGTKPTNPFKVHLVQRNPRTRTIVGGVAFEVTVGAGLPPA